jgi:hypothetical protein
MDKIKNNILELLNGKDIDETIEIINELKLFLHQNSPLKSEPVDCVL